MITEHPNFEQGTFPQPKKKWWIDSVLIKLSIISVLILLLLIPSSWIQSMIEEREQSETGMASRISDTWGGSQLVQGPVLVIPYKTPNTAIQYLYILPESLSIKAGIKTEPFHQGIMDVTGYTSKIAIQGNFTRLGLGKLGIDPNILMLDKARLVLSLSDIKGLKNNPDIHIGNQTIAAEPIYDDNKTIFSEGLQVGFIMPKDTGFTFNYVIDLKGTNQLNFLHIGKTTDVEIVSDWKSPIFAGRYQPDSRNMSDKGFTAKWHVLDYNRPFPQQWANNDTLLTSKKAVDQAVFGVQFNLPVNQYHKTMRTTKYSCLIILLTFVSLFLTELIRKKPVHVFNYILIGAAMVVYYTLLLSFAEHLGYDAAYLIASVSTITLISWFTSSLLANKGVAVLFAGILSVFYGFIYVIIQLEELSLLIGSIALFIIVALLMYFSRKINWEKH